MDIAEVMFVFAALITTLKSGSFAYGRRKLTPVFLPTPTNITAHLGQTVVLQCHVRDLGTKMVVWRRKDSDVPLSIGSAIYALEDSLKMSLDVNHTQESDESYWNLILKDVTKKNAGTYLCQISASKLYIRYITLEVLDTPEPQTRIQKAVMLTGSEYVNEYGRIKLKCVATGIEEPPEDIDWFFQGGKIRSSQGRWQERTQIVKYKQGRAYVSTLIVDRVTTEDGGNYVCRSPVPIDMKFDSRIVHVLSGPRRPVPGDTSNFSKRHNPEAEHSSSNGASMISNKCTLVYYILTISTCIAMVTNIFPVLSYFSDGICRNTKLRESVQRKKAS